MKRAIPFGDRILVRRKQIGETVKTEGIILTQNTLERATDLAVVAYLPNLTLADKMLIENAETLINKAIEEANNGHASDTIKELREFSKYLMLKSLKVGDEVFLNKYVGTDYYDSNAKGNLTVVSIEDIYGVIINVPDVNLNAKQEMAELTTKEVELTESEELKALDELEPQAS